MIKRVAAVLGAGLLALFAVLALRAGNGAPSPTMDPVAPSVAIDGDAALKRFSRALTFPTLSHGRDSGVARDSAAFAAFRAFLEQSYPRVHATLQRELFGGHTLLYTWTGTEPDLAPILLMGHYDVVPVDPDSADRWTHAPFAGTVADGYLWGRGAIDDKINVIAQLEAVEALLERGFSPARGVLLEFGHDEELGGEEGAALAAAAIASRGVRPALVVDEGGAIASAGMIPGLDRPIAVIGIAEKGYVSVEMVVETPGGHSSAPPASTSVGILATAVHELERNRMPVRTGTLVSMAESVGPHLPFRYRLVTQNLWLFGPLLEPVLARAQPISPMLRTTTAATIFQAGVKDNVLPDKARAVVNFRIYPGDTIEGVVEHVRRVVDDERIQLTPTTKQRPASLFTRLDTPAWKFLRETIAAHFPEAIPVPFLIPGGTDARHYRGMSDGVFGFVPVRLETGDLRRAHGNDERIPIDSIAGAIGFYAELIERASDWH
jgi:carboxypeptidase PM20D1